VARNQHEAEASTRGNGHVNQQGQNDHRPTQRPKHIQNDQVRIEVELQAQTAKYNQVEEDQPEATRAKVLRQLAPGLAL
jgi:hypothetical protein